MEALVPLAPKPLSTKPDTRLLTIKQAIDGNYFPLKAQTLRNLLYAGEKQKKGVLPAGQDYIRGINVWSVKQPKWVVEAEELEAWVWRKMKTNH